MYSIRRNVFETNSSSTHSLIICSDKTYNDWMDGKVVYDSYDEEFVEAKQPTEIDFHKAEVMYMENKSDYMKDWKDLTPEMQLAYLKENVMEEHDPYQYKTYDDYRNEMNSMEESFERTWKTEHGDVVHILGYMGYDG